MYFPLPIDRNPRGRVSWLVEITAVFSSHWVWNQQQVGVASFVRLDNDVISSVGPHPWSEGQAIDNCNAGLCHSQKVLQVKGNNELRSGLISFLSWCRRWGRSYMLGLCLIFTLVVGCWFTTRHVSDLWDHICRSIPCSRSFTPCKDNSSLNQPWCVFPINVSIVWPCWSQVCTLSCRDSGKQQFNQQRI